MSLMGELTAVGDLQLLDESATCLEFLRIPFGFRPAEPNVPENQNFEE